MRLRLAFVTLAVVLVAAACSSSGGNSSSQGGLGETTTSGPTQNDVCKGKTLTSPEVGVDPQHITITVIADVNNPIRPQLFQGSWNAVKAWANYMNANGGLACRQIVVKEGDSKLNGEDAKNAVAAACSSSLATVGTTALMLSDLSGMNSCKDKAGNATGLPDLAELQTGYAQQCSPVSFAILPTTASCPYTSGIRTYKIGWTTIDYYKKTYPGLALHGVFVVPKALNTTIAATMALFRGENKEGVASDAEFGLLGIEPQAYYTPIVQAMKQHNSTYARNGIDYKGTVLMRKEAVAQGVTTVKVWDCSVQCYDPRLISEGQSAVEGQYVWLNILPLEDRGHNAELDRLLQYDPKADGFGEQAWAAADAFAQAVNDAIKSHGNDPNSITRANILDAIHNLHSFDANGLIPKTDVGGKTGSVCLVGMQVKDGKFVRIDPVTPGQFDCDNNKPPVTISIDPLREFHG